LATYRFFKPRWWDYKQQISVNLSNRWSTGENRTSAWRRVDNLTSTTTGGVTTTSIDPFNNANRFFYRVYWNDPRPSLSGLLTDPNGKVPGVWKYVDTGGGITDRNVKQGSVTAQSGFWNEKLVFTGSFSRTQNTAEGLSRLANQTLADPNYKNVLGNNNTPGLVAMRKGGSSSYAYGVVTYPFQFKNDGWLKKVVSPLGFVVNVAQNNQAPGTGTVNPLINGEEPPLPHSETRDLGIRYSIPGGKATSP